MAILEQKVYTSESDTDSYDSEDDPNFDLLEESRTSFSKLSIKKRARKSISEDVDAENEDEAELIVPELNEKDEKGFEVVQNMIEVDQVDKLKVEQCKLYLRRNGLRLTGNKDTLIGRIKEHLDIVNCGGEKKYPASSFVVNCKGDACTGDVVMFEQNVYEMFNIASRSASGPPCGKRIVAGRIVKESYGAAKQQHTFTIDVLWSKGEKPLPPLHPLLIKGRNLYKLKTMRQRWQDEGERQKILMEKHNRGSVARLDRDRRIQEKETRKMLKGNRVAKMEYQKQEVGENASKILLAPAISSENFRRQPNEQQHLHPAFQFRPIYSENTRTQPMMQKTSQQENIRQMDCWYYKASAIRLEAPYQGVGGGGGESSFFPNAHMPAERVCQRQPLLLVNHNSGNYQQNFNSNPLKIPLRTHIQECSINSNQFRGQVLRESKSIATRNSFQRQMNEQPKQLCRYYAQGRCYYADQCKYLHEHTENRSYGRTKMKA